MRTILDHVDNVQEIHSNQGDFIVLQSYAVELQARRPRAALLQRIGSRKHKLKRENSIKNPLSVSRELTWGIMMCLEKEDQGNRFSAQYKACSAIMIHRRSYNTKLILSHCLATSIEHEDRGCAMNVQVTPEMNHLVDCGTRSLLNDCKAPMVPLSENGLGEEAQMEAVGHYFALLE
ncbi:hypothetical protein PHYBLDRAFT_162226 [Phycomyces blakesleeanus NRRL 1555(-)]|uniref:Uncharacterized protein n=1 Tax=Phycomyces blakesleeanus (strain ATCC 8743b / DSM 1359 / FGSC 10004 / NBRC 33097 / NRRL 1555) TaxID=763407 RepID=A0A167Q696_PHYB8|nr:hypothetical protein PHYBLDRAFT_162226 [Phycomyces blakesleeanus NRRL 1555(-)]OAD79146.1 hypothetical protein PHYBLDRAFT_162226 [Phycomyces blakesleeanus NRRL 1555(-)]|eukprot:XP_018297186.1 hypothetical protein PHYBLDRAFT_162226 [Phycomyces blakesleeanus NRRL 1555(-)]